jgi:outer membrane protein
MIHQPQCSFIKFKQVCIPSLLIFTFYSLFPIYTLSQDSLSLLQAVELTLINNFGIQISEKNTEIASNNFNRGEAGYYPSIAFNFNSQNSITDQNDPASFIQGAFYSNRVIPNVDLQWVLFDGLRIRANYEQLQKLYELSEGNELVIVQNTVQGVILAYYNAKLQAERLATNRDVLRLSKDRYTYFENRKEVGSAVTFDLLQAKNAMLNDSTAVVSQRLELQKAMRNLNRIMNTDLELAWSLTNPLRINEIPFNRDTLQYEMMANNANLAVQYTDRALKEIALKQSKAGQYPSLIFNPGASFSYNRFEGTLPTGQDVATTGTTLNYYANLSLSFNLYNGGKTRRLIQNARIDLEIASLTTEDLSQSLLQELSDQYNNWQSLTEILAIADENLESAKLNLEIATEKYRNGNITSFEFREVQKTYILVAITQLEAAYNLLASQTDLLRLSGAILAAYE